jgi:phage-related protein
MATDTFDNFMVHKVKVDYQSSGFSVAFGGGYSFDSDGEYPPLKLFTLTFKGYKYYLKEVNGVEVIDTETNADINNMGALEAFYLDHLNYKTFIYNSPVYGAVYVRFSSPLQGIEGIESGHGVVKEFNVVLKEVFA